MEKLDFIKPKPESAKAERVPSAEEIERSSIMMYQTEEEAKQAQRSYDHLAEEIIPVTYKDQKVFVRYCRTNHGGKDVPAYICHAPDGYGFVIKEIIRN